MSPRTTDVQVHDAHSSTEPTTHAPVADSAAHAETWNTGGVSITQPRENSSSCSKGGVVQARTKPGKKPLSSGWKSIAWTAPAAESLHAVPATFKSRRAQANVKSALPRGESTADSTLTIVSPVDPWSKHAETRPVGKHHQYNSNGPPAARASHLQSLTMQHLADVPERGNDARFQQRLERRRSSESKTPPVSIFHSVSSGSDHYAKVVVESVRKDRHAIQHCTNSGTVSNSSIESRQLTADDGVKRTALNERGTSTGLLPPALDRQTSQQLYLNTLDDTYNSWPTRSLHPPTDSDDGDVRLERALSDTSIITASDFGLPKSHAPTILAEISDDRAMDGLTSLCAKGKGLPLVKHAESGGGKSRKYLRYVPEDGLLLFCSMRPPYFKTKILAKDIDRAEAKWCCVVVHARGRAPLRLEVDSFNTAAILKAGLMAAARIDAEKPVQEEVQPLPLPLGTSHQRRDSTEYDMGLSSLRPGHRASAVYDPDAALSVAALLAKEMEDERKALACGDGLSASANSVMPPSTTFASFMQQRESHAAAPRIASTIQRSASLSSIASSRIMNGTVETNLARRSLPRYGGAPPPVMETAVVDPATALRRLRTATEGRGLAALKMKGNGKGRSRVMVRCRAEAGTIGWAHSLPPFTRKNIPAKDLTGASRSVRSVTLTFRNREPVRFETDKLTDAIVLEQGFTCLVSLLKIAA